MSQTTITEALAELKTINKRLESKRNFVGEHLMYPDQIKDPLLKDGGAVEVVKRELQAIFDLQKRIVAIRTGIQRANLRTQITIGTQTATIAEWLAWRKDVVQGHRSFLTRLRQTIDANRKALLSKGKDPGTAAVVNIDERQLAADCEGLENIVSTLDGQLSLKNAMTVIEIDE